MQIAVIAEPFANTGASPEILPLLDRTGKAVASLVIEEGARTTSRHSPMSPGTAGSEGVDAIGDALQRLRRLEKQLAFIVPEWSIAPVVEAYQAMHGTSFLVAVMPDQVVHSTICHCSDC